jgi:hypothetical protein
MFFSWIDPFGHTFANQAARHRADDGAYGGTHWADCTTHRRASGHRAADARCTAGCCADAGADWM